MCRGLLTIGHLKRPRRACGQIKGRHVSEHVIYSVSNGCVCGASTSGGWDRQTLGAGGGGGAATTQRVLSKRFTINRSYQWPSSIYPARQPLCFNQAWREIYICVVFSLNFTIYVITSSSETSLVYGGRNKNIFRR